jgi:hypothetical protein
MKNNVYSVYDELNELRNMFYFVTSSIYDRDDSESLNEAQRHGMLLISGYIDDRFKSLLDRVSSSHD